MMKALSIDDFSKISGVTDPTHFFSDVDWEYPNPMSSYYLPKDTGRKVALSRAIATMFLKHGPTFLWITETGVWPSSEHLDLFYAYRLAHGENRTLLQAPLHLFQATDDVDAFISILYLSFSFVWGTEILSFDRSMAITVSHDEWLEYRFASVTESTISDFSKVVAPYLS